MGSNSHVESVERELKFKGSILSKTWDLQVCVFIPYPYIFQPHSLVAQEMINLLSQFAILFLLPLFFFFSTFLFFLLFASSFLFSLNFHFALFCCSFFTFRLFF